MLDLAIENGYWAGEKYQLMTPMGITDEDDLQHLALFSTPAQMARIALAFYAAHHADAPYSDDDPDEDHEWFEIKKIATLYGLPWPEKSAEQPATPPAAAQAQEVIAPEKPDPAIEAAGELSEDEAKLTTGEPAAPARDKSQDTFISRTAAQARMDDIKAKSLARKARNESAKADVSKAAPIAAATGETNRNEVTA